MSNKSFRKTLTTMYMTLLSVSTLMFVAAAGEVFFQERFDGGALPDSWTVSGWKQDTGEAGKWEVGNSAWYGDEQGDMGLRTSEDAKFYAISADMGKSVSNEGKDLIVQFSVQFPQKMDCGGGYIKLLPSSLNPSDFSGESEYSIMFGPDICGTSTKRVHVIFNYKGQNLLTTKETKCLTDELTHVYTLIVHPDNTYEVRIDGEEKATGSLYEDWAFLQPKTIDDPSQSKPEDWVDVRMIPDPSATKPEDWVDETMIVDPEATLPDDWDEELDGEWEAPMIPNPDYAGEWSPSMIENPEYIGAWEHPQIDNPDFEDDPFVYLHNDLRYVGIELWQVKSGTKFDNLIVTDDITEAEKLMEETFKANKDAEKAMFDAAQELEKAEREETRKRVEAERAAQEQEMAEEEGDDLDFLDEDEIHDEL